MVALSRTLSSSYLLREKVAEFPEEQRATHGRLAWAAKDKISEILSEGARLFKRAPRCPFYLLARLEELVLDPGHAAGLEGMGQTRQGLGVVPLVRPTAIIPAVEGRLVTTLRRTKTSCPNRPVRELPVAISEHAFFVKSGWLKKGFDLLQAGLPDAPAEG